MSRLKRFIRTSILGGVAVILPAAILVFIFKWVFGVVTGLIQPLTNLVMAKSHLQEIIADILDMNASISPLLKPIIDRDLLMDEAQIALQNGDLKQAAISMHKSAIFST